VQDDFRVFTLVDRSNNHALTPCRHQAGPKNGVGQSPTPDRTQKPGFQTFALLRSRRRALGKILCWYGPSITGQ
jgi:hypothetical protein